MRKIDCLKCREKKSCCDFGAWVDLEVAKKIASLGLKGDFYHLEKDKDFPSGYRVGTSYEDNPCSFLTPQGLCAIHKVDYNLKPAHCREFPYENGKLSPLAGVLCPLVKSKRKMDPPGEISMNIFVGNLSFDATEGDVKKLFEGFGNVVSVAIVMRKEKKTPKSRGFGFVQMPDEQQALAAIAALNGKEFMGRVLNVDLARPKGQKAMVWPPIAKAKTEVQAARELKEKGQPLVTVEAEQHNRHLALNDEQVRPSAGQHLALKAPRPNGRAGTPPSAVDGQVRPSGRPGTYRGGRRTRSYMSRRGLDGMQEEAKPRRRSQDNPMRWRKKKDKPRPWQKSPGEHKPWEKAEGEARPWKKAEGEFKPWRKSGGGIKPWKKPAGDAKPWKKPAGDAKPWKKPAGDAKPWKKPAGDAKPWSKSSRRPQKSRVKGRKNPGGYKR